MVVRNESELADALLVIAKQDNLDKIRIDTENLHGVYESTFQNPDYIEIELQQIQDSQTVERAKYYINRFIKALTEIKTNPINDLNLNRWKDYPDIRTDSWWNLEKRSAPNQNTAWYWGNFVPEIPHQLIQRYTRKDGLVLDPFMGSGTTLFEARNLGRNSIGIELNPEIAKKVDDQLHPEKSLKLSITETQNQPFAQVIQGDSNEVDVTKAIYDAGHEHVDFVIFHPPYHDIIKFSDNENDLSNCPTVEAFSEMFSSIVENSTQILPVDHYIAVVIGDKYSAGEWIPLGFNCMLAVQSVHHNNTEFVLKSIVVKNYDETAGKRGVSELWRYRALVGGFYVFKHEYIFIFQKKQCKGDNYAVRV